MVTEFVDTKVNSNGRNLKYINLLNLLFTKRSGQSLYLVDDWFARSLCHLGPVGCGKFFFHRLPFNIVALVSSDSWHLVLMEPFNER